MREEYIAKQAMERGALIGANSITRLDENPTVGENIDRKISYLRAEIERLEQSKIDLEPLLKMRIRDIRQAMDY